MTKLSSVILMVLLLWAACLSSAEDGPQAGDAPATIPEPKPAQRILDKDVAGWIAHLKKYENEQERKVAIFCLIDFGPAAAEAVPELMTLCNDELQPDVGRWSMEALGAIGSAAKDAVPTLLATLNNIAKPAAHRATACAALAQIAPDEGNVRKAILNAFRDSRSEVRAAAIDAAVTIAPLDSAAVPALAKALANDEDAPAAATALRCVGPAGVEALSKYVEKGSGAARSAAAQALSHMGSDAAPALPIILKALKRERDAQTRRGLLLAAARIAPTNPAVLLALVEQITSGPVSVTDPTPDPKNAEPHGLETRLLIAAGPAALPALREALRSRDVAVRCQAVAILARMPQPTEEMVDDLVARAQDKDAAVRAAAVKALDGLGTAAAKAHGALLEVARQDAALQHDAELAALNVSRDPQKPRYRSILETKPDAEVLAALKDQNALRRQEAAEALRARTTDTAAAAGALIEALSDKEPRVRAAAARSLAHFGKYARVAMSTLVEWIEGLLGRERLPDADAPAQEKREYYVEAKCALAALAGMGADARPALPVLARLAVSPHPERDTELRELLGTVLRVIGPDAATVLAASLKSPDANERACAARALGSMGAVAAAAIPDLIELSKSAVDSDAQAALAGLQAIGPVAYSVAAPYLVTVLRGDVFADRRRWAAWALAGIRVPDDGDPKKVIDALLLALLDNDDAVCRAAHAALARIGPPALPRLRDMLKLGEGEAPYWAVRVLARMKADPADVIPQLAELTLPGRRPVERGTAVELLGEYAPGHPEIIPVLLRALGDREDYVARIAVRALTPFGAAVLEPMQKLLRERNPLLRRRALEALELMRTALEAGHGAAQGT